eukprot:1343741-Prymnesium_polylepis.2
MDVRRDRDTSRADRAAREMIALLTRRSARRRARGRVGPLSVVSQRQVPCARVPVAMWVALQWKRLEDPRQSSPPPQAHALIALGAHLRVIAVIGNGKAKSPRPPAYRKNNARL